MQGSRSDEMRSETALYLCARLAVLVKGGTGGGGGGGVRVRPWRILLQICSIMLCS